MPGIAVRNIETITERKWGDVVTLAATNLYSGTTDDLAKDEAYDYTGDIDLATDGYKGISLTLDYKPVGTTDNIILSVFGSLDGTNFDDDELYSIEIDATAGTDRQISLQLSDMPSHSRIGVKTSGTTDTFDYQIKYRAFR